jgi:hypothetical protein
MYPENCQVPVQNSKVITQHSRPLTSQNAQEKLAVFSSSLGILRIGGKKKILAVERGFFVWNPTRLYTETGLEPSAVLSRLLTVVVEPVNVG